MRAKKYPFKTTKTQFELHLKTWQITVMIAYTQTHGLRDTHHKTCAIIVYDIDKMPHEPVNTTKRLHNNLP